MKFITPLLLTAVSCITACTAQTTPSAAGPGFAVVELFTSEGCSSCPPAEAVLKQLNDEYKGKVEVLEFHVDYWNYLGWKDAYSSPAYSLRQQQYTQHLRLESNYTPQAIVNGQQQMVGSDRDNLTNTINKELALPLASTIHLSTAGNNREVSVEYTLGNTLGTVLHVALVQKGTEVNVRGGENSGRKLQHLNVVRDFKTVSDGSNNGKITLNLPSGLSAKDCRIIAYTQQKSDWKITAAAESNLQ